MIEHFYQSVPGWFGFREVYERIARLVPDDGTIVEVGSYKGQSAAFMAVELERLGKHDVAFYCVDIWDSAAVHEKQTKDVSFEEFEGNLRRGGVFDRARPIRKPSQQAALEFADRSVDFVFVDAAHDYENVRADICAWLPKLRLGGVMAGDDYGDPAWAMVKVAVENALPYKSVEQIGRCFWYVNAVPEYGTWTKSIAAEPGETLLFMPVVNRADLALSGIASLGENRRRVVVIDQTDDGMHVDDVAGIYRIASHRPAFTQIMNWMIDVARVRGDRRIGFMHNDAECRNDAFGELLKMADRLDAEKTPWGSLFSREVGGDSYQWESMACYDYLMLQNMEAILKTGRWDETFEWYVSDVDFYRRLRFNGFPDHGCQAAEVVHHHSQTVRSDAAIRTQARAAQDWAHRHYRHKWGGDPSVERHMLPYNGMP